MKVTSPALMVLVVAAAHRLRDPQGAGRRWLDTLWADIAGLGLDCPIDGVGAVTLPDAFEPGRPFRVLAGRQGDITDPVAGIRQALLVQADDYVLLLAVLGSAPGRNWPSLRQDWAAATGSGRLGGPPPAILGSALVYLGLRRRPPPAPAALDNLIPRPPGHAWDERWTETPEGFRLAEARAGAVAELDQPRQLVVLADPRREADLDRWSWSSARQLPPLVRYLVHAAAISDQLRVYQDGQGFRANRHGMEQLIDTLAAEPIDTADLRRLLRIRQLLAREQSDASGLITTLSRLRAMGRTVQVAAANLAAALPAPGRPAAGDWPPGSIPDRDRRLAAWLGEQLADDVVYLQATAERAAYLERLTQTCITERQRRYEQQITLIQASILGAIIMALTGVTALQYQIPVPSAVRAPLICLLAGIALVLPGAVTRWARGIGADAPLPVIDLTALALLGAATGWLALTLRRHQPPHAPGLPAILAAALAGAAIFLGAGVLVLRVLQPRRAEAARPPGRSGDFS
jgi:hypothetical protein